MMTTCVKNMDTMVNKMFKKLCLGLTILLLGCTQSKSNDGYSNVAKRTLTTTYVIVDSQDTKFYSVVTELDNCTTLYITYRTSYSSNATSQIVNKCK